MKVGLISVRSAVAYTSYATVPASLYVKKSFRVCVLMIYSSLDAANCGAISRPDNGKSRYPNFIYFFFTFLFHFFPSFCLSFRLLLLNKYPRTKFLVFLRRHSEKSTFFSCRFHTQTWMQHFGISVMSTEKCQGRTTNLTGVRLISTYLYKMTTQASQCGRPLDSRGRTSATIKDNKERTNNSDAVP